MNDQPLHPTDPDDLDKAFAAFFKKQVPWPWPSARVESLAVPSTLRTASSGSFRSRVTLAASVAALLGLGLYLSSGQHRASQPAAKGELPESGLLKGAEASGKGLTKPLTSTLNP